MSKKGIFYVSKPKIGVFIVVEIVVVILYIVCNFVEQAEVVSVAARLEPNSETYTFLPYFDIAKEILVVVFSVLGSSILSVLFIERRDKNNMISDFVFNDVFSSEDFIKGVTEENKKKMHENLEKSLYFNDSIYKSELYHSIRQKLNANEKDDGCYFEKCEYDVTCKIFDNRIEKKIKKTMRLKSFKKQSNVADFVLGFFRSAKVNGYDSFKVLSITVNGKEYDNKYVKEVGVQHKISDIKSGYDNLKRYEFCQTLDVSRNKPIDIVFCYKTVVPTNDIVYTCRMHRECKNFSFRYKLEPQNGQQYRLSAAAFGFADDGNKTPNQKDDEPEISFEFNDWIFEHDGVSVTMVKKG